jgi:TMEM175 potassium channel family protein
MVRRVLMLERSAHHKEAQERFHDPTRVLALCDGVCAIIITLLVIEIHPPHLGRGETVRHALGELKPSLVAFALSFVVVAIAWVGHRDAFALIRRTDRWLVWLNVLYLFPLCLVPFGASLLTSYWQDVTALRLYGLLLVVISAARLLMWVYATGQPRLLFEEVDRTSRLVGILAAVIPGAVYCAGIAVAGVSPAASLITYAAVPVLYIVIVTVVRRSGPPATFERDFT